MKHPDLVFKNIFLNHVFTHIHIFVYISNLSLFYSHYILINSLLSKIGFYDIFSVVFSCLFFDEDPLYPKVTWLCSPG